MQCRPNIKIDYFTVNVNTANALCRIDPEFAEHHADRRLLDHKLGTAVRKVIGRDQIGRCLGTGRKIIAVKLRIFFAAVLCPAIQNPAVERYTMRRYALGFASCG